MANRTQPVGGARVENDDGPVEGGQCRPSELWQGPNLPGVIQQWVMPDFKAVWRSGSVCIRLRDVLRENKELMLRCEGLKCREEAEERARRGEVWISPELRDIFQDYFTRYDLRGDAVYYDHQSLKQLCTNLVVKLELDLDVREIDRIISLAHLGTDGMDCERLRHWFIKGFLGVTGQRCNWQPGDVTSSDDDDGDDDKRKPCRSGSYLLQIDPDQPPVPFKLRYSDHGESEVTLFSRRANDEVLGYSVNDEPLGLHRWTGTFNSDARTCRLVKKYASKSLPQFEFEGRLVSKTSIVGTWKVKGNGVCRLQLLARLLLPLDGEGEFTLTKIPNRFD
eukprot:TRINITY_DN11584_c0_g1_i1.p1 TRINITY_DN11584_c0_g1~~TRINITY_DN11584_c0_g1_i1.p1  ORF type:complete len:336 (+),score=55.17 TRINITY_DN11584_c0_g1_i1:117-1124(+)